MAKGLGGLVKSIKKKVTLRGVVKLAGGLAAGIPIIGGAIQNAADQIAAGKQQAAAAYNDAAQQAGGQFSAASTQGTFQTAPTGPREDWMRNPLVWVGAGIGVLLLLRKR